MKKTKIITTDEILLTLCQSVTKVLSGAGNSNVAYSPMVQKIQKTCLRPDLGCFVLFDGGFTGLVVLNFGKYHIATPWPRYCLRSRCGTSKF